jgi:hypothetical protein
MPRKIPSNTQTFTYHNKNPKQIRASDCVIRAIAAVSNKTWEEILSSILPYALKLKRMPNEKQTYAQYLRDQGYIMQPAPRRGDNRKVTGKDFCLENPNITAIAHIGGKHIVAIINGKVHDTWDSTNGTIGNFWTK